MEKPTSSLMRMGHTKVQLPFGGCASSDSDEVRNPQLRPLSLLLTVASVFGSNAMVSKNPINLHSETLSKPAMGFWGIKLWQRRTAILFLAGLLVWKVNSFFLARLLTADVRFTELLSAGVFTVLLFAGGFNLFLYIFGFVLWWNGRHRENSTTEDSGGITTRTAMVMPIYHEDTTRVHERIRTTWESALKAGLDKNCDFYLLCDSTDPAICEQEERIYRSLIEEFHGAEAAVTVAAHGGDARAECEKASGRFFLLRRRERKNWKAGNIANFLVNHDGSYDFMLVLDADSVMLGETIRKLILRMQSQPGLAILQSTIIPIGAITPFARAMQFTHARCLPLYATGLFWFLGRDSVYWGHNALLRIKPFIEHANLPIMPGQPPLGGSIMSQDIVEAALLGRAGWAVEWDIQPGGSYDEFPSNIMLYGRRDRRWCQGNFQHFWLVFGDRIRFGHRFYFGLGIFAYAGGPLLLAVMLWGFVQGIRGFDYQYEPLMFWSVTLFLLTTLSLPRVLGLVRFLWLQKKYLADPDQRLAIRFVPEVLSTVGEFLFSFLISPLLFYMHARFVIEILTGQKVQWVKQSRNPAERISWPAAATAFAAPTVLGMTWAVLAYQMTPGLLPYIGPILLGLIFAIPIAVVSSDPQVGDFLDRQGIFCNCLTAQEKSNLRTGAG